MLRVDELEGGVRLLTLDEPSRRNALDAATLDDLERALGDAKGVRCWLLRGASGHFCSGWNLSSLEALKPDAPLPDERIGEVFDRLQRADAPTVAFVEGSAFGAGFELACACDFRVAASTAVFCIPPAKLGIVYAPKGIARVASVIGQGRARSMFLSARRVSAEQAVAMGLADEVCDEARALAFVAELSLTAPLAVAGMKRIFRGELEGIDDLRRQSFHSDDAREGITALIEKRKPAFKGS
ncbi:MAG: enoyl-CoA hydratase/isomerase family protein [Myxococcaceae bacterium]|nr:enoyl-CoA hydratase/isomerase family protein [Myxococcaceae bacterium]